MLCRVCIVVAVEQAQHVLEQRYGTYVPACYYDLAVHAHDMCCVCQHNKLYLLEAWYECAGAEQMPFCHVCLHMLHLPGANLGTLNMGRCFAEVEAT